MFYHLVYLIYALKTFKLDREKNADVCKRDSATQRYTSHLRHSSQLTGFDGNMPTAGTAVKVTIATELMS